jgi:Nucleotidyl transferase AbiEii toxin, Type IV TA system
VDGYRHLRQRLTGPGGVQALAKPGLVLNQVREMRADQYGIRTLLRVDGIDIKFEIVLEGRIALDAPSADDRICGVTTLTPLDMAASKLLANSDRWRDDAVLSRDLIDLAMMAPPKKLLQLAIDKAKAAYGDSVDADLAKAIQDLRDRPHRLDHCMQVMRMDTVSKAVLWARIRALSR